VLCFVGFRFVLLRYNETQIGIGRIRKVLEVRNVRSLLKLTLLLALMFGCVHAICFSQSHAQSDSITILSWNVESGGSDPKVIAAQLVAMPVYDIYCMSEVDPKAADFFAKSLGEKFGSKTSATGNADRLQIHFNKERFELLEEKELARYQDYELNNGTHRSPIFVRLRDRKSGLQFIVMTNHFARGNAELRKKQAIGLREWARDQSDAVINIGDFNLDFDFKTQQGNEAFPEMLRDNVYQWVKPVELIDTNWADLDGDGKDNYPDSMLDFAFVAGPAKNWKPSCQVIVRDGDFPDDKTTSDHRPIELILTLAP
jgi:endonuclease/exonuclease/phosphatase family metal-dependent hydrolase